MTKIFANSLVGSFFIFLILSVPQLYAAEVVNETALISGTYTVPNDGQVTITIIGADGGEGSRTQGGLGATVTSVFDVISGQVIRYVVGEAGNHHAGTSAGGGGSTGVYLDTALIMVAGGGGGGDNNNAYGLGGNTVTDGDSGTGTGAGVGGAGGNGGGANSGDSAGGGGINSSGDSAAAGGGGQAPPPPALPGLLSIAAGGSGAGTGSAGGDGFSGGGGADTRYSGGAGGYSGGGAAGRRGSAGGGGSYVNSGATGYVSSTLTAGGDGAGLESDGSVIVDFRGLPGGIPLPSGDTNDAPPVCGDAGGDGGGNISGVVNTYYPATASVSTGATTLTLGTPRGSSTPIAAGDTVMIVQLQDAQINSTNTTSYGDDTVSTEPAGATDIRQTGLYELAVVQSYSGNTLTLTSGLTHAYHHGTNQRFQVIRVPRYTDVTLSGDVTAAAWDGSSGGIVTLDTTGTLDLDGYTIDVTGLGFRGGVYTGANATTQRNLDYTIADTDANAGLYAEKGEGIAGTPNYPGGLNGDGYPGGDLAAGAPGNGGGSGQSHNSGGGGGSNIGGGGRGGDSWPSASPPNGGFGGGTFDGYPGRLVLGGGGGAGNQNNESAGGGGAGGGIVFINVNSIVSSSNGGQIVADGDVGGSSVSNDAAGGGGAGGTLLIRTASTSLPGLTFSVMGGNGGDVNHTAPHGPGGGGGGGAVYLNQAATGATLTLSGGQPGTYNSGAGTHDATAGWDGHSKTFSANDIPYMQECYVGDYTMLDSSDATCAPTFTDISTTGTALGLGDDDEADVTLPFSFFFYETLSTSIRISSNGGILFGTTDGSLPYSNADIPTDSPAKTILPFWDDLNPSNGGEVYWEVLGTAPDRRLIVQWDNVPHYYNVGAATFQAVFYEGTNNIFLIYDDVDFGDSSSNYGASATIGLNNGGGLANKYSYNTDSLSGILSVCYFFPNDYSDAPASYGDVLHNIFMKKEVFLGADSDVPDHEIGMRNTIDADGDNTTGRNDENGVTFRSPAGGDHAEIYADVAVSNDSGADAHVCAWLDRWTDDGSGNAVLGNNFTGTGDAETCQTVGDNNGIPDTVTFYWGGLPNSSGHTYARFRVCTTLSECNSSTGAATAGEVEDYRIDFDFHPTAVTIGKVELSAVRVTDFLTGLDVEQMDDQDLLELLNVWDPGSAEDLTVVTDRDEIFTALNSYLDPDGDGRVAVFSWDTLEERGTIGFYVDRLQGNDTWTRINNDMLPGLINAPMGGEYQLADPEATSGSYQYQLIEQEARGTIRSYGPYSVELP